MDKAKGKKEMKKIEIIIKEDYIKLGQLLKLAGMADSGAMAKQMIVNGEVLLNQVVEYQRGKKVVRGDVIVWNGQTIVVK